MKEPFVLGAADGARWVIHPPQDPYGDGYIYTAETELHEAGLAAKTIANIDGAYADMSMTLSGFMESLAADWQGWDGPRTWQSMERELTIDARHDGRGYVSLGVTLRASGPSRDDTAWSARAVFVLEAGEQMTGLAADLTDLLRMLLPRRYAACHRIWWAPVVPRVAERCAGRDCRQAVGRAAREQHAAKIE